MTTHRGTCLLLLVITVPSWPFAATAMAAEENRTPSQSVRKPLPSLQDTPLQNVPRQPSRDSEGRIKTAPIVVPRFTWNMEPRFGRDDNSNKVIDLRNTCQYVYNLAENAPCPPKLPNGEIRKPNFQVHFDASQSQAIEMTGTQLPILEYRWLIKSSKGYSVGSPPQSTPQWTANLEEGPYTVTLTVLPAAKSGSQTPAEGFSSSTKQQIVVRDFLIVAIGDSYMSGEGNPEQVERTTKRHRIDMKPDHDDDIQTVFWADDGIKPPSGSRSTSTVFVKHDKKFAPDEHDIKEHFNSVVGRDHLRSHRSTLAATPQAALDIERADPHTSVTFVSVAASGATIDEGILGPYFGVSNEPVTKYFQRRGEPMPPQIDQVQSIVAGRRIDTLIVGIGGNDIGFGQIIVALYLHPHGKVKLRSNTPGRLAQITLDDVRKAVHDGHWEAFEDIEPALVEALEAFSRKNSVKWETTPGLDNLPKRYETLKKAIDEKLAVEKVFIMNYPDPTQRLGTDNPVNGTCPEVLRGLDSAIEPDWRIDYNELEFVRNQIVQPLNTAILQFARWAQWIPVNAFLADYVIDGHGICGTSPYDPDSYVGYELGQGIGWPTARGTRWMRTAKDSEAIQGRDRKKTKGTFHPNEFGHQAAKKALLAEIRKAISEIK